MGLPAWFRGRWDIAPDVQAALPFHTGLAMVNVRRIELTCWLALANDAIELAMRKPLISTLFEVPVAGLFIGISLWARHWRNARAQSALAVLFLAVAILNTQWGVALISTAGVITPGYLIRLLTFTLLFVLSPGVLAALLTAAFASYWIVIGSISAPDDARTIALVNAAIVSVICLVTGWLIYAARRSDHDQKLLIQSQNDRLAAQNAELDQLMAITAHDLRSPLFGLRNLFNLALRRSEKDPALPLRVMRDGITGLDSMLALVTRLLDAHRAEHAPLGDHVHDDLRTHIIAAERRLAPLAEAASVTVDLQLSDSPLCARFDAVALAQILDNLLGNAVRHTPTGQPLNLSAFAKQGHAVIAIQDCGPGIDSAAQATMFEKFRRGSAAVPSTRAGAGMGLYIAATCAARIGATLVYRQASPTGSIFEVSLPIVPP